MRKDRLEPVCKLLDRGVERQAVQLSQPGAIDGWPKTAANQLLKALPGGLAFIQQKGVVPCLGVAGEVIRRHPHALSLQGALAPEELLAVGEPVQRVAGAVIGGEVQLEAFGLELAWAERC